MIRTHDFNTRWWGGPVGIVDDPAFFNLPAAERQSQLDAFEWVEYRQPLDASPPLNALLDAGFFQADTQIAFLLNLGKLDESPSTAALEVRSASAHPFTVSAADLAHFRHERFRHLPGCSGERIDRRYALWANDLLQASPETCVQVLLDGRLQGWFLSRPARSNHLELTLAMLAGDATISGMLLYQKACIAYGALGYRVGEASFSVTNTAVHNIYAKLGARFAAPLGNWLWINARSNGQDR